MVNPSLAADMNDEGPDDPARCISDLVAFRAAFQSFDTPAYAAQAAAIGYGWWSRSVLTAAAVSHLHNESLRSEASPLVRTLLHHAVSLVWLRLAPSEAIDAIRYEYFDRRHKIGERAWAQDWVLDGIDLGPAPEKSTRPRSYELLRNFKKLCKRVGTSNWYLPYMLESAYAHASAVTADVYIAPPTNAGLSLLNEASQPGVPLRVSALFAGVATHEFAELIKNDGVRAIARQFEADLGVDLTVSG